MDNNRKSFSNAKALLRKLSDDKKEYEGIMEVERAAKDLAAAAAW